MEVSDDVSVTIEIGSVGLLVDRTGVIVVVVVLVAFVCRAWKCVDGSKDFERVDDDVEF